MRNSGKKGTREKNMVEPTQAWHEADSIRK